MSNLYNILYTAALVIIGLLVVAVNTFFPGFFTEMFNSMKTKLNENW